MRFLPRGVHALVIPLVVASGCGLLTGDCGEGEFRETEGRATVGDVADTVHVDAYVSFNENHNHAGYPGRQLVISVQSVSAPNPAPAPAALLGHVPFVHLELPDGTVVYRGSVTPAMKDELGLVGFVVNDALPAAQFESLRRQLIANMLVVVIETDGSTVQMRKAAVALEQSTGWRKYGCQ
jgi:hypothetical protein